MYRDWNDEFLKSVIDRGNMIYKSNIPYIKKTFSNTYKVKDNVKISTDFPLNGKIIIKFDDDKDNCHYWGWHIVNAKWMKQRLSQNQYEYGNYPEGGEQEV